MKLKEKINFLQLNMVSHYNPQAKWSNVNHGKKQLVDIGNQMLISDHFFNAEKVARGDLEKTLSMKHCTSSLYFPPLQRKGQMHH